MEILHCTVGNSRAVEPRLFHRSLCLHRVADPNPDPPDPHVFGPRGSASICQRYGSGSLYYKAKIVRKTLISTVL